MGDSPSVSGMNAGKRAFLDANGGARGVVVAAPRANWKFGRQSY